MTRRPAWVVLAVLAACRADGDDDTVADSTGGPGSTTTSTSASTDASSGPGPEGSEGSGDATVGDTSTGDAPDMPTVCSAASPCFYVTESGAGAQDGSSWGDAFAGLPSSGVHEYLELPYAELQRGAIYLLADGTYPGYVLGDQGGGDERIMIRKATIADHGEDEGWDDALGDGEAVFQSDGRVIVFSPGAQHYDIDGRRGEGKSPGGYGFRLYSTASRDQGTYMVDIDATGAYEEVGDVWDIRFSHVEFDWDNGTAAGPCGLASALQVHGPVPSGDWTIADSYIHHASGGAAYLRSGSDYTFENVYIYLMGDETGPGECPDYGEHGHWETFWVTIGSGFELRGCTLENAYGAGQTGWVMLEATDVLIEDNLFFCSDPDACDVGGNGIIGAWSMSVNTNVLITHNTFRDLFNGAHYLFEQGTNIVITDNTYENAPGLEDDP